MNVRVNPLNFICCLCMSKSDCVCAFVDMTVAVCCLCLRVYVGLHDRSCVLCVCVRGYNRSCVLCMCVGGYVGSCVVCVCVCVFRGRYVGSSACPWADLLLVRVRGWIRR